MIREIINFTKDIIEDCPDIMQSNLKPNGGLYIFVDMDEAGNWVNRNGVYGQDYLYLNTNDSESSIPISEITALEEEECWIKAVRYFHVRLMLSYLKRSH